MSSQNTPTDDDKVMLDLIAQVNAAEGKSLRHLRRTIRNRIFRIRAGSEEHDRGLREYLVSQLSPDMSFDKFTFNWDVSPANPLKVITPYDWTNEGGTFEIVMVQCDDGIVRPQKMCDPAGFTKQA